jgi:hypothetical protein
MSRRRATTNRPAGGPPTAADEGHAGWARLALLVLLASVLMPLVAAGPRSVLRVLTGVAGLALATVGMWRTPAWRAWREQSCP